jgi:hypothetical protein
MVVPRRLEPSLDGVYFVDPGGPVAINALAMMVPVPMGLWVGMGVVSGAAGAGASRRTSRTANVSGASCSYRFDRFPGGAVSFAWSSRRATGVAHGRRRPLDYDTLRAAGEQAHRYGLRLPRRSSERKARRTCASFLS